MAARNSTGAKRAKPHPPMDKPRAESNVVDLLEVMRKRLADEQARREREAAEALAEVFPSAQIIQYEDFLRRLRAGV